MNVFEYNGYQLFKYATKFNKWSDGKLNISLPKTAFQSGIFCKNVVEQHNFKNDAENILRNTAKTFRKQPKIAFQTL